MTSRERRDELRDSYEQKPREAAVYALRNRVTGRVLIASTPDMASLRNRLEFGVQTNSTGVLDRRLVADAQAHGVGSFELEVLDALEADPTRDDAATARDLAALEELWREKATDPTY
jgi:hypothetical protein